MFERNFLVAINLNNNELKNAIVHRLSESPPLLESFEGSIYYNITDHCFYYFNGTKWVNLNYIIKLLGDPGNNIASIYEGTNQVGNEFRFRSIKGDDYLKLIEDENYVNLNFDINKLDQDYNIKGTPIVVQTNSSVSIDANVLNVWNTPLTSLSVTLNDSNDQTKVTEYMLQFVVEGSGFELNIPGIKWTTDPLWENGYVYQVSIINNMAIFAGWEVN